MSEKTENKVTFPCLNTKLVPIEKVQANNYNPNNLTSDRMEVLKESILANGFCFPIVTIYDPDLEKYIIIDGFHRYTIAGKKWLDLPEIPVVVLDHDISQRMIATVQFNKARGHHQVDLDADLVASLLQQGLTAEEISKKLGLELETIHRYTQVANVAEVFKDVVYSQSWYMEHREDDN